MVGLRPIVGRKSTIAANLGLMPPPPSLKPARVAGEIGLFGETDRAYCAQAQALGPESAQICEAIWVCSDAEASCGEPLPPYRRQVDGRIW